MNNGHLPEGWQSRKLGDVCEIEMGQSPSGESYNNQGIGAPLLNGPTEFGPVFPVPIQWTTDSQRFAEPGDILFCVRGATTGRKNVADQRYSIGRGLAAIRAKKQIASTDFVYYALDLVTQELLRYTAGSTFPNLSGSNLRNFEIALPPLEEQKRIAAIIAEQMQAVEDARRAAEAELEAAEALAAAFLREVFERSVADEWIAVPFETICDMPPSKSISTNGEVEVMAVTTACLTETGFDSRGIKKARMNLNDASASIVNRGEVLVARSNTTELVGRVAMFPGEPEGIVSSDLTFRLIPLNGVRSEYLTAFMSYLYISGYWREHSGGASGTMKKITKSQLRQLSVPLPPVNVQSVLSEKINELMDEVNLVKTAVDESIAAIDKMPATILRRAFSGGY